MKACLVLPEHFRSSTVSSPISSMFPSWCVSNFALDSPLPTLTLSPKFPTLEMVLNLPNHLKPKIWVSISFLPSSSHIIYQNIWLLYPLNISSAHPRLPDYSWCRFHRSLLENHNDCPNACSLASQPLPGLSAPWNRGILLFPWSLFFTFLKVFNSPYVPQNKMCSFIRQLKFSVIWRVLTCLPFYPPPLCWYSAFGHSKLKVVLGSPFFPTFPHTSYPPGRCYMFLKVPVQGLCSLSSLSYFPDQVYTLFITTLSPVCIHFHFSRDHIMK